MIDPVNLVRANAFPYFALAGEKPLRSGAIPLSQSESYKTAERRKRILVIDDEAAIAKSLAEILNHAGYEAVAFLNGHAAIDSVRHICPDIVLSDVMMPKLNGIETVLIIREICPATRILLFSGQSGTADILQEARTKGHEFEVLPKPIHPVQLLRRLSSLGSF